MIKTTNKTTWGVGGFLAVIFLLVAALPVYAQTPEPTTDDLWDISQGIHIIHNTGTHPISDIRNMFGGVYGTVEKENTIFEDSQPAEHVHSVEWKTATPVRLENMSLYAIHDADARQRGILTFRLFVQTSNGNFEKIYEFSPSDPYSEEEPINFLRHHTDIESVIGQRFRVEFVQRGTINPHASGPRIVELDGFGEVLPGEDNPISDSDLWDASQENIDAITHSGTYLGEDGEDIRNMFGGNVPTVGDEVGNIVFRDGEPAGTLHWVEWKMKTPVLLEKFTLFAGHDAPPRDARYRGFSQFTLYAKQNSGDAFEKIYEYSPANPYGDGDRFNILVLNGDIEDITAQEFRAEFVQYGDIRPIASGPRIIELDGFGKVVESAPEPVIIVPGMLVSFNPVTLFTDKPSSLWSFSLFSRPYYTSLVQQFEVSGFLENENVFIAHYDWRKPINSNVDDYLKPIIEEVKQKTGANKVDLVAHSMGGLLARSYIQGEDYQNDVDQLITLGTPHQGSADTYVAWEGGDFPATWSGGIKFYVRSIESSLNYIKNEDLEPPLSFRTFFPSLKELLPITQFIIKDDIRVEPNTLVERNKFLTNLQAEIDQIESRGVDVTAIVGTGVSTLGRVTITPDRTLEDKLLERWRDGHPITESIQPDNFAGDQRVLAQNASIGDNITTLSEAQHDELPHVARKEILEVLGIHPEEFHYEPPDIDGLFGIVVLSPIDPKIECGDSVLSKDQNTFREAQYTTDPNNSNAPKILIIGNPPEGVCTITLTGTDMGQYAVVTTYADSDETVSSVHKGSTTQGKVETYTVSITKNSFEPPVEDVVALMCQLPDAIENLKSGGQLKPKAYKLYGIATSLCSHAKNWQGEVEKNNPQQSNIDRFESRTRMRYERFTQELDTQIDQGNLNSEAIRVLLLLQRKVENAGI